MAALSASTMLIKTAGIIWELRESHSHSRSPKEFHCTGHAVAIQRNYLGIKRVPLALSQSHRSSIDVKCMAVQPEGEKGGNIKKTSTPSPTIAKEQTSTKLGDVFSFAGAAPETINGRLAMVGFVSAIGVELASGRDLFSQLSSGDGVSWFVLSAVLLSAASLVPMLKGVTAQSKSQEIMSSSAEIWSGRFAMLGLVALAFTEYVKGGPLV